MSSPTQQSLQGHHISLFHLCQPYQKHNVLLEDNYSENDLCNNNRDEDDLDGNDKDSQTTSLSDSLRASSSYYTAAGAGSSSLDTTSTTDSASNSLMLISNQHSSHGGIDQMITLDQGVIYDLMDVPSYHPPSTPDLMMASLDKMSPMRDELFSPYRQMMNITTTQNKDHTTNSNREMADKYGNKDGNMREIDGKDECLYKKPYISIVEVSTYLAHSTSVLIDKNKKYESFLLATITSNNKIEIIYSLATKNNVSGMYIKQIRLKLPESFQVVCVAVQSVEPPILYMYSSSFSNGGEVLSVNLKDHLKRTKERKIFRMLTNNSSSKLHRTCSENDHDQYNISIYDNSEEKMNVNECNRLLRKQKKQTLPSLYDLAYGTSICDIDIEVACWMNEQLTKSIAIIPFPKKLSRFTNARCVCPYKNGIAIGCSDGCVFEISLKDCYSDEAIMLQTGSSADINTIFYIDDYPTCMYIQDTLGEFHF